VDLLDTFGLKGWRSRDQAIGWHQERGLDRLWSWRWSRFRRGWRRRGGWRRTFGTWLPHGASRFYRL
jgi:hypothetical protein